MLRRYSTNLVTKMPIFRPRIPYILKIPAKNVKPKTFRPRSALRLPVLEKSTCSTRCIDISTTSVHPQCGGLQPVKKKNDEVAVMLKDTSKLSSAQLSSEKFKDVTPGKSKPSCSTRKMEQTGQSLEKRLHKGIVFSTDEVSIEEKGFIEIPNQKPSIKSPRTNKVETKGSQKTPIAKADEKMQGSTAISSKPVHLPSKSEETIKSEKSTTGFFSRSPFVRKPAPVKDNKKINKSIKINKSKENQPPIKNTSSDNNKNETVPKYLNKDVDEKLRNSHMKNTTENKTKTMPNPINNNTKYAHFGSTVTRSKPVHTPSKNDEALKSTKPKNYNEKITPITENAGKSKKNEPTSSTVTKPVHTPCKSDEALKSTKPKIIITENAEKSKKNEQTIKKSCSDIKKNETEPKCPHKDVNQKSQNDHTKNVTENKTIPGSTVTSSNPVQVQCKSGEAIKSKKSNTCNETITPTMMNPEKSKKIQPTVNETCSKKETEPKCAHKDVDPKLQTEKMPNSCMKTDHCGGDSANATAALTKSQCGAVAQEVKKKSTCDIPPPPPIPCDLRQLVNPIIQTQDEDPHNSMWTQMLSLLKKYF